MTGAIVGVRSRSQVEGIIGAGDFQLSNAELSEIENAFEQELVGVSEKCK